MNQFLPFRFTLLLLPIIVWALFWKGYGMWTAAKHNQKKWFVALLILNTFGILEIVYIFKVAKIKWADVKEDIARAFS